MRRRGGRDGGGQRLERAQETRGKQSPEGAEAPGEARSAHTLLALVRSIWIGASTAGCEEGGSLSHSFSCVGAKVQKEWGGGGGIGQGEAPGAGHLKGGAVCGQQGRLVRGQLASSVRGRWNSAGTSGREQRKYWGGGAKGAQREGQGKGWVARTLLC